MNQQKGWLDRLTDIHGRLSDLNAVWFPFLFLKPRPEQEISPLRRLAMTACFSWYAACFWPVKQILFSRPIETQAWLAFSLKCVVFFSVWFRVVTSPLWNRRARQLSAAGAASAPPRSDAPAS
jgi:hypothetical protein